MDCLGSEVTFITSFKERMKKPKARIRNIRRKNEVIDQTIGEDEMHSKDISASSEGADGTVNNIF